MLPYSPSPSRILQADLVAALGEMTEDVRGRGGGGGGWSGGTGKRQSERLAGLLGVGGEYVGLANMRVRLPLWPDVTVAGLLVSECAVFKSAMSPLKLTFLVEEAEVDESSATTATKKAKGRDRNGNRKRNMNMNDHDDDSDEERRRDDEDDDHHNDQDDDDDDDDNDEEHPAGGTDRYEDGVMSPPPALLEEEAGLAPGIAALSVIAKAGEKQKLTSKAAGGNESDDDLAPRKDSGVPDKEDSVLLRPTMDGAKRSGSRARKDKYHATSGTTPTTSWLSSSSTSHSPSRSRSPAPPPPPPPPPPPQRLVCIFKQGDDLRQDQLVLQLFRLMDRIFRSENLDLRLTPYRVVATSAAAGLVEFVPATPLADVLREDRTIRRFLQTHNPDSRSVSRVQDAALDNFVRSCAGYCVMTYVLGVGDRHLDNLLLTRDGRLFHIDFGYMFGRDPKPFPPPVKLCPEMVEAMGGVGSAWHVQFVSLCCEAFHLLRKNASIVLSLLHLMAGSSLPDVEGEAAVAAVLDKLQLELEADEARVFMQRLLEQAARAIMPQVMETAHRWAQYWR